MRENEGEFQLKPISSDTTFPFQCYPGISCFNRCCHEIDVVLTPLDILRIKQALKIPSDEFLAKYTRVQKIKGTDIPLIKLEMQEYEKGRCVFVSDEGCKIYESRPLVCRNYPTGVATVDPGAGEPTDRDFLIQEEMCKGHLEKQQWSLEQWKTNQKSTELEKANEPWLEIVARLKSFNLKDDQDQKMNVFLMACFDLDTFRRFIFESAFLKRFQVEESLVEAIKNDDEELLKFSFEWLEFALFGEGKYKPQG